MAADASFLGSSIGKKVVMAATGVVLFGFVLGHMVGNLQLYLPNAPEALRHYATFLREFVHGWGLWAVRGFLLLCAGLHVWSATVLTLENRAARPVGYRQWTARESTYASRTMRYSGVLLLAFIVYHLLHFTVGNVHPSFQDGDPYHNIVAGFQKVPVAVSYIVAMLLLGLHLRHGLWSLLQTLGLSHPRYKRYAQAFAALFAAVIVLGNISFPVAVLAGIVK